MTLTLDTFALAKMENAELAAARDRLKAAMEQLARDLRAIEVELSWRAQRAGGEDARRG